MVETLDKLPGEDDTKTITSTQTRIECENCGKPAHFKLTFLLPKARTNPASRAYGRDDCTWCSDKDVFSCRECKDELGRLEGYSHCAQFPAITDFAHMFLKWTED